MASLTFSDITTAIAFISIIGLIMTYDHITIINKKLEGLHSKLSAAMRQAEAADIDARSAIEKCNVYRKKMVLLEEKLNDYHSSLMDEIASIAERQVLSTHTSREKYQGSFGRQLYEMPSTSSRRTDTGSHISRKTARGTILPRDTHRSTSAAGPDYIIAETPPPKEKPESGKNSMRSVIANMSLRAPWRSKSKETRASIKRRMASFHL
ncbi:hypothetical protein AJ79_09428 [Helicocarpus griseus UAMH5409]|uniref:Uncharacterized protein n=1 Tax=Helicocarpus griseus UAMH5409 TaxID=1447875 RepID=A0A2B7WJT7_9EURO|nr:hypothetical protein AJ79_09428 [Helicocarpus griseus UAMH5409]